MNKTTFVITFCLLIAGRVTCNERQEKWLPQIDLNIKYGNKRSIGRIGAFGPIKQTTDKLAFVDFRFMADTREDQEGNFGLGQRWLNSKMEYIFGIYGYFDRRFSNLGNKYNQLTFGSEYLSLTWDYRANIYIPQTKVFKKQTTHTEVNTSSLGANQIIEIVEHKHIQKEVPLRGIDIEFGRSIPGLPDLRLYSGSYYYQGRSGVALIKGYQIRSNYNINDYVSLQGEAKHDNIRKTNYYLGVELRIPIGKESQKNRDLTVIEKRMVEAPIRDVDIVANVNESKSVERKEVEIVPTEYSEPETTGLGGVEQVFCFFAISETGRPQATRKKRHTPANPRSQNPSTSGKTSSASNNNPAFHVHGANCCHNKPSNTQSTRTTTIHKHAQPIAAHQKDTAHIHSAHCGHSHSAQLKDNHLSHRTSLQDVQTLVKNKAISTHHDHTNCGHSHGSLHAKTLTQVPATQPMQAEKINESTFSVVNKVVDAHKIDGKSKTHSNSPSVKKQLSTPITLNKAKENRKKQENDHQHDQNCEHYRKHQTETMGEEHSFEPTSIPFSSFDDITPLLNYINSTNKEKNKYRTLFLFSNAQFQRSMTLKQQKNIGSY